MLPQRNARGTFTHSLTSLFFRSTGAVFNGFLTVTDVGVLSVTCCLNMCVCVTRCALRWWPEVVRIGYGLGASS